MNALSLPVTGRDSHGLGHALDVAAVVDRCARDAEFHAALVSALYDEALFTPRRILGTPPAKVNPDGAPAPVLGLPEHATPTDHSRESHALADDAISVLPRSGLAYSVTLTAPMSDDPVTFRALAEGLLAEGLRDGLVLGWAVVVGRKRHEHPHGQGAVVVRDAAAWRELLARWARRVGAADPSRAWRGRVITGWRDHVKRGDSETLRLNLARDHNGRTVGVLAYALDHHGDLLAGGALESLSRPRDMPELSRLLTEPASVTPSPTCPVCHGHVSPRRKATRAADGTTRAPTCSPKCSATQRQRATRPERTKRAASTAPPESVTREPVTASDMAGEAVTEKRGASLMRAMREQMKLREQEAADHPTGARAPSNALRLAGWREGDPQPPAREDHHQRPKET